MGSLLCKQNDNDETVDIVQEFTDDDSHSHNQLQTLEKKNNIVSDNRTKISRASSIKALLGRKVAVLDGKDTVNNNNNRDDAPLLIADDINDQQRQTNDTNHDIDKTQTEDKAEYDSVARQLQTDLDKTTSENSSGYQSHAELTSLESLLPNEVAIPDETAEITRKNGTIRRHQSLPANISTRRNSVATRGRVNTPEAWNEREGVIATGEEKDEPQIMTVDEYKQSTSNPNNRPKAARGIRSRLNSFNRGLRRSGKTISDTLRSKKPRSKDESSDICTTKSSKVDCDFSDIIIFVKRLESATKRINYSDPIFKYKASLAVSETVSSNGKQNSSKKDRVVFKDVKVKLNFSESSNICEITLPRCILDMKRAECSESDDDEVSCV